MLKLEKLFIKLTEENKEIVSGVSLEFKPGEVHLLNGKNGSGKSTLVNSLMGNPIYTITSGSISIENEEYSDFTISKIDGESVQRNLKLTVPDGRQETYDLKLSLMEPNERSLAGVFLANQYPMEIPGVSLSSYLRLIYNSRRPKEEQLNVYKFKQFLKERAEIIKYPEALLLRNLNEGFSGGEKKKTEILQMLILEPRYVMLDEIDSGLDKHSVKEVFEGLVNFKKEFSNTCFIIITHYDKVQEYLTPDFVHEMEKGKLIIN
ncbi:MAG: ATP-binding cassette domain-containing protein [Candidatus Dojkabacteria bacterium]